MLNRDEILRRTGSGLDVFKHYIPGQWRVGRNFHNPLYEDRKASCNIFYDRRNDCYRLKDFGNDDFSGDCFDIVGKIKGLNCSNPKDFVEILKTINRDLHLGLDEDDTSFVVSVSMIPDKKHDISTGSLTAKARRQEGANEQNNESSTRQHDNPKKIKPYSIIQKPFTEKEMAFWQQYGITPEVLKTYKVFL